uniref:HDC07730 n=1 Tax=Drosophila melanogaster TaxID=7227 RepID=Q6IM23_DROME|nr:TPA_inf: HDC07730 [Drosophila melanogaster]
MIRAAMVVDDPNMVAWLPYLNFLRFLKRNFYPRTDLRRLLQVGLIRWIALSDAQKRLFEPEVSESWRVWLAGKGINDAADYFAVLGMARKDVVQCDAPSTTAVLNRDAANRSRE